MLGCLRRLIVDHQCPPTLSWRAPSGMCAHRWCHCLMRARARPDAAIQKRCIPTGARARERVKAMPMLLLLPTAWGVAQGQQQQWRCEHVHCHTASDSPASCLWRGACCCGHCARQARPRRQEGLVALGGAAPQKLSHSGNVNIKERQRVCLAAPQQACCKGKDGCRAACALSRAPGAVLTPLHPDEKPDVLAVAPPSRPAAAARVGGMKEGTYLPDALGPCPAGQRMHRLMTATHVVV